jgi:hypothetical protein
MEKVMERVSFASMLWPALVIVGVALATVVIFYGMDNVVRGAHDTFHDFRHVIGMPCH